MLGRRSVLRSAAIAATTAFLAGSLLAPVVHGSAPALDLLGFGQAHGPDSGVNVLPTQLHSPPTFATVDAAQSYTLAVDPDGNVWTWGANGNGQLGIGSTANTSVPTEITSGLPAIEKVAGNNGHLVVATGQIGAVILVVGYNAIRGRTGTGGDTA